LIEGKPMTLYIIVPPMRVHAYAPLLRLWLSGLIMALTLRKTRPEHRTLMLVDEAGNLGRMDAFLTASTLLRSFGLTLWCHFQNSAQLSIYGAQANTLVDNAAVIQIFGVKNHRMATDLANLLGGISPDELMKMHSRQQILLIDGKLFRAQQVRYYDSPSLLAGA
jgi:type IV secretion system protein VirD4